MEAEARRLVKEGRKTDLFEIMERKGKTRLASGVWAQAFEEGDEVARELVHDAAWALATGLASVQNLLSLQAIIVGGGLGDRLGAPFVERIADEMRPLLFVHEPPKMLTTEHRDLSGAIGGAVLAGG
jgi:glucokinase